MGKDFHLYKTKAAHDAGIISDYHEPWVSMTLGDRNDIRYNAPFSIYQYKYLTFEALEDNCTFTFTFHEWLSTEFLSSFSYSVDDGKTWVTTDNEDMEEVTVTTPAIDTGETILFKGDATAYFDENEWAGVETSSSGEFNVSGNIMSLLYGDDFWDKYTITGYRCFFCFFGHDDDDVILNGFDNLVSANNLCLPATTLGDCCYESMFENCTSLTTAPELPATTLEVGCYGRMFAGCTLLTTAPELPATTLAQNCYGAMFNRCTSLTTAPVLPATTLVNGCYYCMFSNCSSLNYIKAMFTTFTTSETQSWVSGVATTGTFVKNSAATWTTTGANGVPTGWTVQTASE